MMSGKDDITASAGLAETSPKPLVQAKSRTEFASEKPQLPDSLIVQPLFVIYWKAPPIIDRGRDNKELCVDDISE